MEYSVRHRHQGIFSQRQEPGNIQADRDIKVYLVRNKNQGIFRQTETSVGI